MLSNYFIYAKLQYIFGAEKCMHILNYLISKDRIAYTYHSKNYFSIFSKKD